MNILSKLNDEISKGGKLNGAQLARFEKSMDDYLEWEKADMLTWPLWRRWVYIVSLRLRLDKITVWANPRVRVVKISR